MGAGEGTGEGWKGQLMQGLLVIVSTVESYGMILCRGLVFKK